MAAGEAQIYICFYPDQRREGQGRVKKQRKNREAKKAGRQRTAPILFAEESLSELPFSITHLHIRVLCLSSWHMKIAALAICGGGCGVVHHIVVRGCFDV